MISLASIRKPPLPIPGQRPTRRVQLAVLKTMDNTKITVLRRPDHDMQMEDDWIDDNVHHRWARRRGHNELEYWFENATEAMVFKLRFG